MLEIFTDTRVLMTLLFAILVILTVTAVGVYIRIRGQRRGYKLADNLFVDIGNAQIIGTREKQDDSFATSLQDYGLMAIVADGIGGYINGNLASRIAVETYLDEFEKRDVTDNLSYFFQTTAVLANERIRDEFGDAKGGTTVVAVVLIEDKMYWTSVGDSNIAVLRGGRLIEVNRKENVKNWLEDQYRAGAIGREEAMGNPMDKRLVNYVGYDGFKKADESDRPIFLKKKDKVLIYSDGVEVLGQIGLEEILSKKKSAQDTADEIMDAIEHKQVRSKDNSTIIILNIR